MNLEQLLSGGDFSEEELLAHEVAKEFERQNPHSMWVLNWRNRAVKVGEQEWPNA